MVKSVFRNLLFSLIITILISCTTSPTFTRKDIEKVLERICKDEFGISVTALRIKDTIWIYAPFENLINENNEFDQEAQDNIRHIFLSLKRTILSMDKPPKFYAFVASNIKDVGIDIYHIGFVPDIIKFEMQLISQNEFDERIAYIPFDNPASIGDKKGNHIAMDEITMGDFITYLILQKLRKTFYDEKVKEHFEINAIDTSYSIGKVSVTIDIMIKKYTPLIPNPFEEAKRTAKKFLKIYKEFSSDIVMIEINDTFNGVKRTYSPKALLEG